MQIVGTVTTHRAQIIALEQIEHLQDGDPLAVGRKLPHVVAAVVGRDRLDPLGRMVGEILQVEKPVALPAGGDDLFRDRTAIKRVATPLGDQPIVRGQLGILEHLADFGWLPLGTIGGGHARVAAGTWPAAVDDLADRESFFRVFDGRRQKLRQSHRPESLPQLIPTIDAAGNGPRVNAAESADSALAQGPASHGVRTAAAGVKSVKFFGLGVPVNAEEVASQAARARFHEAEHRIGGDGRIGRGSAFLEDVEANLGCQRLRAAHDAMSGDRSRAALMRILRGAIVLAGSLRSQSAARGALEQHDRNDQRDM